MNWTRHIDAPPPHGALILEIRRQWPAYHALSRVRRIDSQIPPDLWIQLPEPPHE